MILLMLMAMVFPLLYTPWIYNYYYYPKFIFLILITLVIIGHLLLKKGSFDWNRLRYLPGKWWLLGFITFSTLSALASPYRKIALLGAPFLNMGLLTYVCAAILFLYTYLIATPEKLRQIMIAMFFTAAFVSLYGLAQFYGYRPAFTLSQSQYFVTRSTSTIGTPNIFGTYLMVMFLLNAYFYLVEQKWSYLVTSAIIYACMLGTLTRSVWIGSFVVFVFLAIYQWKKRNFQILGIALILTTGLVLMTNPTFKDRIFSVSNEIHNIDQNDYEFGSGRGLIWAYGWREWTHSTVKEFLLGSGPDTFWKRVYFEPEVKKKQFGSKDIIVDKAFNIFLEMALTFGLPALISMLGFYYRLLYFKNKNSVMTILSLIIIAYLIQGFFNKEVVPVYPLLMILLAGLAYFKSKAIARDLIETPTPTISEAM